MAGSDGADTEFWGTREELLLASAVGRHGTRSWDSVAMEVQARIHSPCPLSPQTCRRRYRNIQRRYAADARRIDVGGEPPEPDAIPLLEALRRLRVAELRREVERSDVSIMSLQLRVRRLEEDRERSPQEEQSGNERPDPSESEGAKKEADPPASSPENLAVEQVRGGDSGRSCNHSNSVTAAARDAAVRVGNGADRADPVVGDDARVFAGEGSYNGSSDTVAKGAEAGTPAGEAAAAGAARTSPARRPDAGESGESVAESKGEAPKESSDVQSSASLSRRRRGRRKAAAASGGSSGGDEADADADADEVSPASSRGVGESQPLASLLEIIRSHEYGSLFERRLQSQECATYRRLIRRHMDLATVRHRLAEGAYAADVEFHRDLLLLFTNAVVFFPTSSTEYIGAVQLRHLVRRQMAMTTTLKPAPSSPAAVEEPVAPPPPPAAAPEPETDPDPQGAGPSPLLDGTSAAPPLVACRKRSSISGKAAAGAAAEVEVKEEEEGKPDTEKEVVEVMEKKRSAVTGSKGLRTNKARGSSCGGGNRSATDGVAEAAIPVAKRRSAVSFLTRMNRGPAGSPNGTLLQTLKASGSVGKGGGGGERRRRRSRLEGRRKAQVSRAASAASGGTPGKQPREQGVPPKRGVGRPPKRPPPPLPPPPAKRGKAVEVAPPARAAAVKKRGRR